ncbi:MAG: peroxiredoxin-like family protein [Saprospiraceae bacterium]
MKYFILSMLITLASCSNNASAPKNANDMTNPDTTTTIPKQATSLQAKLDARKTEWAQAATVERKRIYQDGIQAVIDGGIYEQAKNVGDKAPGFTLKNATGQEVRLSDYLEKGPVILTWYRGGWCPYCNLTLNRLQQELPAFQAAGANLLALTPELPDKSISTSEKHGLAFEVLSDIGNTVAKDYGIVFKLTPEVAEVYHNAFDLEAYNGDDSDELPLAATYIIQQDGTISYAFLDAEYRNRAEPADILAALKAIQ